MIKSQKNSLFILRVGMGWLFFYSGITKILNPQWTSAGYLKGAKTFADFFNYTAQSSFLPFVDFINEWGLTLIGLSLIFGLFVRLSSVLGFILMLLYYLPILEFPYIGTHSFVVDEHIIYALIFPVFAAFRAGHAYGLAKFQFFSDRMLFKWAD